MLGIALIRKNLDLAESMSKHSTPTPSQANVPSCGEEGHRAAECEAPRLVQYDGIPDMTTDEAWQLMVKASEEKDIDDFKTAAQAYLKSDRAVTFADIESRCREAKLKIYLIALVSLLDHNRSNH